MESAVTVQSSSSRGVPPIFLRVLNWTAKAVPPIARWVEEITALLLERYATPEQLIAQIGRESDVRDVAGSPAATGPTAAPITLNMGESPNLQSRALGLGNSVLPEDSAKSAAATGQDSVERAAQEGFLRRIQESFERTQAQLTASIERGERRAETAMRLRVAGIVFTFLLIGVGAYLAFFRDSGVLGTLSTLVGLLAGAGSLMLRQLEKSITAKIASAEQRTQRMETFLQAIHVALSMSGPNRDAHLSETAAWLRAEASSVAKLGLNKKS